MTGRDELEDDHHMLRDGRDGDGVEEARVIPFAAAGRSEAEREADEWALPPDVEPPPPDPRRRPGMTRQMAWPYTQEDYEFALAQEKRRIPGWFPHRCAADYKTPGIKERDKYFNCYTVIPDPRKLRYCVKHALQIGYPLLPEEIEEWSREESRIALSGLTPVAVETLRRVMDDPDAPAGARAKAATDVLDRTGFGARSEVGMKVEAQVIDMTAVIRERLEAKRGQLAAAGLVLEGRTVEVEAAPDQGGDGA